MSLSIDCATIIGDGAMGTLCALLLAERGVKVTLWGRSSDRVATLRRDRENRRYLPGRTFPNAIDVVCGAKTAFARPSLIVSAVPCQHMRSVWSRFTGMVSPRTPIVSVAKGIEIDTLMYPTQIIRDCMGDVTVACLSGPCISSEVAQKKPTSVVVAAVEAGISGAVQRSFSNSYFRVYTTDDLLGVEMAGAVKNVIALAAGICDGIEAGDNAKASLVTRGLVEIGRLGQALGARPETLMGLAGVGDLMTTCISRVGRNRSAGERIGRGASTAETVESTPSVIEGIPTTRSVLDLASQQGVEMPIVRAVASVLFEGRGPADAIKELMTRPLRSEHPY